MAVQNGHECRPRVEGREQFLDVRAGGNSLFALMPGMHPIVVQAVRGGNGQQPRAWHIVQQGLVCFLGFGGDGAGINDGELSPGRRRFQPIAAATDLIVQGVRYFALRLCDLAGREAKIYRTAVFLLHMPEPPSHDRSQLVDIGGLKISETIEPDPDERCAHRLVRATFRRQGDSRGRADHHEARILVAGVKQGVEAAVDEGVIEGTDRQDTSAEQRF